MAPADDAVADITEGPSNVTQSSFTITDSLDTNRIATGVFAVRSGASRMSALAFRRVLGFSLILGLTALGAVGPAGPAAAASDRLGAGQSIAAGQWIGAGTSSLTMGADGNLVLRVTLGVVLWTSGTAGYQGARLVMRPDGNLVVYDTWNVARWSSNTAGRGVSTAIMQSDGNLVVYNQGRATWASNTYRQAYALSRFYLYGWSAGQWPCLNQLWQRESGWNERAGNKYSGAYGIPQAYPASKMAVDGADYLTNPRTQIHWGQDYIAGRYGTPCGAWAFELSHGWY